MFQSTTILGKPEGDTRISERAMGYARAHAREELFDLVIRHCVESGISKATLARRLGKDPAQISRLLGGSGNWTIDTFAELLFAIDGSLLTGEAVQPWRSVANNSDDHLPGDGQFRVIYIKDHKRRVAAHQRDAYLVKKNRSSERSQASCK